MPGKERTERVEEYRKRSREADDLVLSGQKEQAIEILRYCLAKAKEADDEDYRLFFDAELLNCAQPDYDRQIGLLKQALAWQEQNGIDPDSFLVKNYGVYYSFKGEYDEAIKWYAKALEINPKNSGAMCNRGASLSRKGEHNEAIKWFAKALEINPKDYNAMRNRGASLSWKGEYDEAIKWYGKALEINPRDYHAIRQRGVSLSKKGEDDEAIKCYDKALEINPKDSAAMRQRGVSLSKKGEEDEAITWYKKALDINPRDSVALRNWAVLEYHRGHAAAVMELMRKAVKLDPSQWRADFRLLCELTGRDFAEEWRTVFPDKTETMPAEPPQQLPDLRTFIVSLRKAYKDETETFLTAIRTEEDKRKKFLEPESKLNRNKSVLMVLRQWNSYTPAIPSMGEERSRGGGYFLWHEGKGTVVDPGYSFIENLNAAGCRIRDIDNIVLTHAHNDHTIDFETLCALLHEYNDELQKGAEPKKVRMYLSNGAFMKFAGMMNLKDADYTDHVFTLNADTEFELAGGLRMRVLAAYHDDLLSRDQCVGLFFTIGDRAVLFTADTGLFPLDKDAAKPAPNTADSEIWDRYPKDADGALVRPDLMVVHIGSVKETELSIDFDQDPKEACYPNHLGIIGTARVITMCRPRLAVVSEFGEEMKTFRLPLMEGLQKNVVKRYCEENGISPVPRVIPGDLPFIYDLKDHKVYCCVSKEWKDADTIEFGVDPDAKDPVVHYFDKRMKSRFDEKPKHWVKNFEADREDFEGMYFIS